MTSRVDNRQLTMPFSLSREQVWRPIHYLGSKLRLTESIRELLADLDPTCGTVCDLFAGSGTVALALSSDRNVVAADIQEYSRVLCTALLQPAALDKPTIVGLIQHAERSEFRKRLRRCLEPI